jgi:hypothetical protein
LGRAKVFLSTPTNDIFKPMTNITSLIHCLYDIGVEIYIFLKWPKLIFTLDSFHS